VAIPGGTGWSTNGAGTRWRYADAAGSIGGITRIVVRDKSNRQPGLVRFVVKGKTNGSTALPPVAAVRGAFVVGTTCASHAWNPPSAARPRCDGNAFRITCR
jgi:hypothetical protein